MVAHACLPVQTFPMLEWVSSGYPGLPHHQNMHTSLIIRSAPLDQGSWSPGAHTPPTAGQTEYQFHHVVRCMIRDLVFHSPSQLASPWFPPQKPYVMLLTEFWLLKQVICRKHPFMIGTRFVQRGNLPRWTPLNDIWRANEISRSKKLMSG